MNNSNTAISITEFLDEIANPGADLYLLTCGETIVYDNTAKTVYIPADTHGNANLNPIADFRYHVGHTLLWSRHTEIQCSSSELYNAVLNAGFELVPFQEYYRYMIYTMVPCDKKIDKHAATA